jgi:hypothetical protein
MNLRTLDGTGVFSAQRPCVPMEKMRYISSRVETLAFPDGTSLLTNYKIWHNNLYAVAVYEPNVESDDYAPTHVTVQRFDRQPARDWRHLQQIKNDVCGPDWEAVELYPAQSRVVDLTNTTHLWVYRNRLDIGFEPPEEGFSVSVTTTPLS